MTLEEMRLVDVRTVDRDSLVDVTQVHIDEGLPKEERLKEFVRQVKNPYCFRVGNVVVKNVYSGDGVSLRERFEQFARTLEFSDIVRSPQDIAPCHGKIPGTVVRWNPKGLLPVRPLVSGLSGLGTG